MCSFSKTAFLSLQCLQPLNMKASVVLSPLNIHCCSKQHFSTCLLVMPTHIPQLQTWLATTHKSKPNGLPSVTPFSYTSTNLTATLYLHSTIHLHGMHMYKLNFLPFTILKPFCAPEVIDLTAICLQGIQCLHLIRNSGISFYTGALSVTCL
jgi:hypothetical protein